MATDDVAPTFGLWYDFRQKPSLGDYARFYAGCLEEIEDAEGLGYAGEVAEGLIELHQQAPFDHFCFWARLPGITHEGALANLRPFASEVMPKVRDAVGA